MGMGWLGTDILILSRSCFSLSPPSPLASHAGRIDRRPHAEQFGILLVIAHRLRGCVAAPTATAFFYALFPPPCFSSSASCNILHSMGWAVCSSMGQEKYFLYCRNSCCLVRSEVASPSLSVRLCLRDQVKSISVSLRSPLHPYC